MGNSPRRKLIDNTLQINSHYYKGIVLDIGGRNRGDFIKPKSKVLKWIFADINSAHNPDVILDVMNMKDISDCSIDVINATELFEHVKEPEVGIRECYRTLKINGVMVITMPFLYQVHGDPFDFQRWTADKWEFVLKKNGFNIEKLESMGGFLSVLAGMLYTFGKEIKLRPVRWFYYPIILLLGIMTNLDNLEFFKKGALKNFTTGYFIIARKQ